LGALHTPKIKVSQNLILNKFDFLHFFSGVLEIFGRVRNFSRA